MRLTPARLGLSFLIAATTLLTLSLPVRAADWSQWLGPKRDAVWRETGILDKFPSGGPNVRWRMPIGGSFAGVAAALHLRAARRSVALIAPRTYLGCEITATWPDALTPP